MKVSSAMDTHSQNNSLQWESLSLLRVRASGLLEHYL